MRGSDYNNRVSGLLLTLILVESLEGTVLKTSVSGAPPSHPVKFLGMSGQYFKIWIINVLLISITGGIYSAWADVRKHQYFYGNTHIGEGHFSFHGRAIDILLARAAILIFIAMFFLAIYFAPLGAVIMMLVFMVMIPRIVLHGWRYAARTTRFGGIQFDYHMRIGRAYLVMFVFPALCACAVYAVLGVLGVVTYNMMMSGSDIVWMLALIWVAVIVGISIVNGIYHAQLWDLYAGNTVLGEKAFSTSCSKREMAVIFLKSAILVMPFILVAGYLLSDLLLALFMNQTRGGDANDLLRYMMFKPDILTTMYLAVVLILVGAFIAGCWQVVALRNYMFNSTKLGDGIQLRSTMKVGSYMALQATNALIVTFTLGLGYPITQIRHARYMADATQVEGDITLTQLASADKSTEGGAFAEETTLALDITPAL
ncbi:hypothetical protein CIG19_01215 [Enterobacterales bacterium CwR94]|nr:hypothetical protein CIG19_01215 [Enterobacterales bacterium CwR94]